MSRLLVADDRRTVFAELAIDTDGSTGGFCHACPWTVEPQPGESLRHAIDEASDHVDHGHSRIEDQ